MSSDPTRERPTAGDLRRFERNRYFNGKLMTARDMEAEQAYHANRLNTLARTATGSGVLSGLEATMEGDEDRLEVTVEPGVAIDRAGRLIVVPDAATRTVDAPPSGDVVYLHLAYSEARRETVPVPGSEAVTEADCTYNRIVETFEVTCETSPPESYKPGRVPAVEFPSRADVDDDEAAALGTVARSYRENAPAGDEEGATVFLGAFEWGSWTPVTGATAKRPHVYDNDMLYAALVRHVTDFGNPHEVAVDGRSRPSEDVPGAVLDRLDALEASFEAFRSRVHALERYVMHRSLVEKHETFFAVGHEFENLRAGEIAAEIVEEAVRALDEGAFEDEPTYRTFVAGIADLEEELGAAVEAENRSTEEARERYAVAIDQLQEALGDETDVLQLVVAQDAVCEAATDLERAVNV